MLTTISNREVLMVSFFTSGSRLVGIPPSVSYDKVIIKIIITT